MDDSLIKLKRVNDIYPALPDDLPIEIQQEIYDTFKLHKLTLKEIAVKFNVDINIIKRIIYNN